MYFLIYLSIHSFIYFFYWSIFYSLILITTEHKTSFFIFFTSLCACGHFQFACVSIRKYVFLSFCLNVCQFLCLRVCLFICLFVYLAAILLLPLDLLSVFTVILSVDFFNINFMFINHHPSSVISFFFIRTLGRIQDNEFKQYGLPLSVWFMGKRFKLSTMILFFLFCKG